MSAQAHASQTPASSQNMNSGGSGDLFRRLRSTYAASAQGGSLVTSSAPSNAVPNNPSNTPTASTASNPVPTPNPAPQPSKAFALDTADAVVSNLLAKQIEMQKLAATQAVNQENSTQVQDASIPAQAVPTAVDQLYQEQQLAQQVQAANRPSGKESIVATSPDTSAVEAGAAIQYVEQEKQPEIPVEVEGFLQHVDSNTDQAPEEIILADLQNNTLPKKVPKQSVVVLPITPEIEKKGGRKNPKHSVKWLVEWSKKLIKMFEGSIVYRPTHNKDSELN